MPFSGRNRSDGVPSDIHTAAGRTQLRSTTAWEAHLLLLEMRGGKPTPLWQASNRTKIPLQSLSNPIHPHVLFTRQPAWLIEAHVKPKADLSASAVCTSSHLWGRTRERRGDDPVTDDFPRFPAIKHQTNLMDRWMLPGPCDVSWGFQLPSALPLSSSTETASSTLVIGPQTAGVRDTI